MHCARCPDWMTGGMALGTLAGLLGGRGAKEVAAIHECFSCEFRMKTADALQASTHRHPRLRITTTSTWSMPSTHANSVFSRTSIPARPP